MFNALKAGAYRLILLDEIKKTKALLKEFSSSHVYPDKAESILLGFKHQLIRRVEKYFNNRCEKTQRKIRRIKNDYGSIKTYYLPDLDNPKNYEVLLSQEEVLADHQSRIHTLKSQLEAYINSGGEIFKLEPSKNDKYPELNIAYAGPNKLNSIRRDAIISCSVLKYLKEQDVSDYLISDMFSQISGIDSSEYHFNKYVSTKMQAIDFIDYEFGQGGHTYPYELTYPSEGWSYLDLNNLQVISDYKIPKYINQQMVKAARNNLEEVDELLGIG
jgi:hypothetical protein